jgi:hypothetical protein
VSTSETIAAYRAAAAKLGEALDIERSPERFGVVRQILQGIANSLADDDTPIGLALDWLDNRRPWLYSPRGWRWITDAVRLRLVVESTLLEQTARQTIGASDAAVLMDNAQLGALVLEWAEGVAPTQGKMNKSEGANLL